MAPGEDDMESLYGGEDKPSSKEKPDSIDEENMEGTTALVPLGVLQDKAGESVKPGDEIVVKVKAVHGDEAEIYYAPKKEGEHDASMHEGKSSDDELEELGKEY